MTDAPMPDPQEACGKESSSPAVPACRVCGEALAGPVLECCACDTPHHERCWRFNRGCAVYGCGSRSSRAPRPALAAPGDRFEIVSEPDPRRVAGTIGLAAVLVVGALAALDAGSTWINVLGPAYFLSLLALVLHATSRVQVQIDRARGTIGRTLFLAGGRRLFSRPGWLRTAEVVELHLHRRIRGSHRPSVVYELFALLPDGSRRLLQRTRLPMLRDDQRKSAGEVAERVAALVDCTVRHFDDQAAPSPAEIARALEQWKLDSAPPRSTPPELAAGGKGTV